ncbi:hypothetical protein [Ferrimonas pelagia]|uniref:Uncharacterized protein n=1 Tax=Ferrimonas pelagia TaxID=1177826 RepID=A0ABP9ELB3_9GAMM
MTTPIAIHQGRAVRWQQEADRLGHYLKLYQGTAHHAWVKQAKQEAERRARFHRSQCTGPKRHALLSCNTTTYTSHECQGGQDDK